jgi:hypothetical protein
MASDERVQAIALGDLSHARPADTTLQNLLAAVAAQLELCGRLPIYEYEAKREGHWTTAAVLHDLADAERASFQALSECLRRHLVEGDHLRVTEMPTTGPRRGQ